MSEETVKTTVDQLAIIPETEVIEPVVQCGVLYLGTAPPSPGRRGLDSIQEPFSHRYPVDGTNTVRGNLIGFERKRKNSNLFFFLSFKVLILYFRFMIMVFN
jgi:hypothetical protein